MRSLTPLFRQALLAALALPTACGGRMDPIEEPQPESNQKVLEDPSSPRDGGTVTHPTDARAMDAISKPDAAPTDATFPFDAKPDHDSLDSGACSTLEGPPDSSLNCAYNLTLADPLACDFSGPSNTGSLELCARLCGNGVTYCRKIELAPEPPKVQCMAGCIGRKPEGLCPALARGVSALAIYFADAARLEAASVDAFRIFRRELAVHGAPKRLTRAASRAARDEVRHARTTRAIARRFGGRAAPVEIVRRGARSLEEIALENAVEGCVNETFGALVASYQAEHAADPSVRAAMKHIARDETRHAELAWEIARWLEPRLSPDERARVRGARQAAVARLAAEQRTPPPSELRVAAGLPSAARASHMMDALKTSLWA